MDIDRAAWVAVGCVKQVQSEEALAERHVRRCASAPTCL